MLLPGGTKETGTRLWFSVCFAHEHMYVLTYIATYLVVSTYFTNSNCFKKLPTQYNSKIDDYDSQGAWTNMCLTENQELQSKRNTTTNPLLTRSRTKLHVRKPIVRSLSSLITTSIFWQKIKKEYRLLAAEHEPFVFSSCKRASKTFHH